MAQKEALAELIGYNERNRDRWVASIAAELPAGSRLLDVGAGEGRYRHLFGHCAYQALDFARYHGQHTGLQQQQWRYGPLGCIADAAALPLAAASFDAALCTEVLEHVPEPIMVLGEIARVLRPGGRIFLSAPLGAGLHQQPYHFYGGFTPHFYRRFLGALGFSEIVIEPNGRFFRLLLQEIQRGVAILGSRRRYPPYHPLRWLLRAARTSSFARWLTRLDDEIPLDDFTAGYHVSAIKNPPTAYHDHC